MICPYIIKDNLLLESSQASISIDSLALQRGLGFFSTLKLDHAYLENYTLHLKRLKNYANNFQLPTPSFPSHSLLKEWLKKNEALNGLFRVKVMLCEKSCYYLLYPLSTDHFKSYQSLISYPYPHFSAHAQFKSCSYGFYHYAHAYAQNKGFDDACIVDPQGYILESSKSNIFCIRDDHLYIPEQEGFYLKGCVLQGLLEGCKKNYYTIIPKPLDTQLLRSCYGFTSNSLQGIQIIHSIDKNSLPVDLCLHQKLKNIHQVFIKKTSLNLNL